MTERSVSKRSTKPSAGQDIGYMLPILARAAADKARARKTPLTRSAALAAAPWDGSFPSAWETRFREAYADRLEELGCALPAKPSGASGPSQSDEARVERGLGTIKLRLPQSVLDKLERDAERVGCSRAKLIESLVMSYVPM